MKFQCLPIIFAAFNPPIGELYLGFTVELIRQRKTQSIGIVESRRRIESVVLRVKLVAVQLNQNLMVCQGLNQRHQWLMLSLMLGTVKVLTLRPRSTQYTPLSYHASTYTTQILLTRLSRISSHLKHAKPRTPPSNTSIPQPTPH
ncbi:hypothetical protein FGO68_gene2214 [Halteria grandinella]|uniref:Uncharacterized protein n=1 Tax=Halteria grandinella TaxID=5974 RepID=A0A8J8T7C0_HALGN|nr:hypothetical protein FGO68_gene2214 [Halteria grandinella]